MDQKHKKLLAFSRPNLFSFSVNVLIFFSILLLTINLKNIVTGGGWSNRADFFLEGNLAPTLPDFIFNEIVIPFFLIYIIAIKPKTTLIIIFIAAAFAYFNRSPIILVFFALFLSSEIPLKKKIAACFLLIALTFAIMYMRVGSSIFDKDVFSLFFLTYPYVGFARLMEAGISPDVNTYHAISIFIKPIDAIFFSIDYLSGLNGELSAARFVGAELSQFVYLPLLGDSYNAFGTLVYPFILIFGWYFGLILFVFFIITMYYSYRLHFGKNHTAFKIIAFFALTGTLFSWNSPFIWILPFFFPRFISQDHSKLGPINNS